MASPEVGEYIPHFLNDPFGSWAVALASISGTVGTLFRLANFRSLGSLVSRPPPSRPSPHRFGSRRCCLCVCRNVGWDERCAQVKGRDCHLPVFTQSLFVPICLTLAIPLAVRSKNCSGNWPLAGARLTIGPVTSQGLRLGPLIVGRLDGAGSNRLATRLLPATRRAGWGGGVSQRLQAEGGGRALGRRPTRRA